MNPLNNSTAIILPVATVTENGNFVQATVDINKDFVDIISEDQIYFRISAPELAAILAVMDFKIAEHEAAEGSNR